MNLRKLLDWKTLFIYVHRWTGIVFGLLFVVWFVSGMAMMYVRMPELSVAERLGHVAPLDFSTAAVTPADALRANGLKSARVRLEMYYDGRPVYRFDGDQKVYADTGERVPGASREDAVALIRRWVPPEFAATVRYDGYLLDSDVWTLYSAQRSAMPLHRLTVGDPAGTVYYVSEKTGEVNHKTDRRGRFWGFLSAVLHYIYIPAFRRQSELWREVVGWGAVAGAVMALLGIVVGFVRLRIEQLPAASGAVALAVRRLDELASLRRPHLRASSRSPGRSAARCRSAGRSRRCATEPPTAGAATGGAGDSRWTWRR